MHRNSVRFRVVLPAAAIVATVMAAVLLVVLAVTARVAEEYEDFVVAEHAVHVEQALKGSLDRLVAAGLAGEGPVLEAFQKSVLEELRALWTSHGVDGAVLARGAPLATSVPPDLLPLVLEAAGERGPFHLYRGLTFLTGYVLPVPAWGWRVVVVSHPMPPPILKPDHLRVFYLVPLVVVATLLIVAGLLALLRRNLQRPLDAVLGQVARGAPIAWTGVQEVDRLGGAVNDAVAALRRRNEQLDLLQGIALSVQQIPALDDVLRTLLEESARIVGTSYAAIGILGPGPEGQLQRLLRSGPSPGEVPIKEPCREIYGRVRAGMRPVTVGDPARDPWWGALCAGCCVRFENFHAHPAPSRRGYSDVVLFLANKPGGFTPEDESLAGAIAAHALTAIERHQDTERLRQSEGHYRGLAEGAQDLIFEVGPDLALRYVNRFGAHFFLAEPERLVGRALADLVPGPVADTVRRDLEGVVAAGRPQEAEWLVAHPQGEIAWNVRLIPLPGPEGDVASVLGVGRDLTARRRAESALAAEKERLAATLRSIGEGIIACDRHGRVTLLNKVAEDLTGAVQGEAGGRPLADVVRLEDPQEADAVRRDVQDLLGRGWAPGFPRRVGLLGTGGKRRLVDIDGTPLRDPESRVVGAVLIVRDMTDEQRREEEVQRAQRLESLGLLAGGIAHDFNNILTGILGNVSLAEMLTQDNPRLARALAEMEKAALRATGITRQLLTFSRGGAPVKATFNLGALLRETADFALHGSPAKLVFAIPEDLWWADADEGQVGQVVTNLVVNALQAMPQGGTVTVSAENAVVGPGELPVAPGRYVKVTVADTGAGIPPANLPKIFDPYFTTKASGTGLGLASCYSIVTRHGGHIAVASRPGAGTTFTFLVPAAGRRGPAEGAAPPAARPRGRGRVLVMDDEEIIRHLACEALAALGYTPVSLGTGEEALAEYGAALAAKDPYVAVILDLTVPGAMGGKELIRRLREVDPGVRAIVTSGYSNDPVMANFRDYGFRGALAKPFRVADLEEALRRLDATEGT